MKLELLTLTITTHSPTPVAVISPVVGFTVQMAGSVEVLNETVPEMLFGTGAKYVSP